MNDLTPDTGLLNKYRSILAKLPSTRVVPRESERWPAYLKYLRKDVLEATQDDFWGLIGVKKVSGSKYEHLERNGRLSRNLPLERMKALMDLLGLEWETRNRFGRIDEDSGAYRLSKEGVKMLDILERNDISVEDLEVLVLVHKHYTKQTPDA